VPSPSSPAAGNLLRENTCPVDMNTVTYKYDAENQGTRFCQAKVLGFPRL
jgi:hypothetical protein